MQEKRKKILYVGIVLALVCFLLFFNKEKVNVFLSDILVTSEESPVFPKVQNEVTLNGITSGIEIVQPLVFERRIGHLGIKIGTYMRENISDYEICFLDKYGNVLGKIKENAMKFSDNQYYFLTIERQIELGEEYYLKITSSATDANAVTFYASNDILNQKPVMINGEEQNSSLLVAVMNMVIEDYVSRVVVVAILLYFIYVLFIIIDWKKCRLFLREVLGYQKLYILTMMLLGIILLFSVLNRTSDFEILYSSKYNSDIQISKALLDDVVVEQSFIYPKEKMNCIEVKFATYLQIFQNGYVHFELYEDGNSVPIREGKISASTIQKERVKFSFEEIEDTKNKQYKLKLYTTRMTANNAMHVYYYASNEELEGLKIQDTTYNGNLVFHVGTMSKSLNWVIIVPIFLVFVIGGFLGVFILFEKSRKVIKIIAFLLLGMILGIGSSAYSIYHEFSIEGIIKLFLNNEESVSKVYTPLDATYKETFQRKTRIDGSIYGLTQMIELTDINTKVDTISITLADNMMEKRSYNLCVFLDTGNGYNDNEKYEFSYVYDGKSLVIVLPISCLATIYSIRIDIGKELHMSSIGMDEIITRIENIVINENDITNKIIPYLLIAFVFEILLIVIFVIFNKIIENKNNFAETLFVICGIFFGAIMMVLVPIEQIPDEGQHVVWTMEAVGGEQLNKQLQEISEESGLWKICGISGEQIDINKYVTLFTRRLEFYHLEDIIDIDLLRVLQRPGQTIGVLIAVLLKLPVFWIYFLGELGGLLIYIFLGLITLKLLPGKKLLMVMIMLTPMALQQAGSFSYDSLNNVLSFLLIAYIIHLKYVKEKVYLKDLLIAIGIALLLFYIKTIYAGLLLLMFIVPFEKYEIKIGRFCINKQWVIGNLKKTISIILILIISGSSIIFFTKQYYVELLLDAIFNFSDLVRIVWKSFIDLGFSYVETLVANFGWADTPVAKWYIYLYSFILLLLSILDSWNKQYLKKPKLLENVIVVNIGLIMVFGIMFSMLSWSFFVQAIPDSLPMGNKMRFLNVINGIQGRYFIPILPFLLLIPTKVYQEKIEKKLNFICVIVQIISMIYLSDILLQRYWI